jgi:hypothetical protein
MSSKSEKYLRLLRWALWLTLCFGVPVCFYWAAFLALGAKIAPEGDCIYFAVFPIVPILFAIADACLAIGMLIIFLIPLWQHQDAIKHNVSRYGERSIKYMIRNNIRLSLIAIISGVVGLTIFSALNFASDGSASTDHFPIWALFVISFDNIIGITAALFMTPNWLPRKVLLMTGLNKVANSSSREGQTSPTRSNRKGDDDRTFKSSDAGSSMLVTPAYAIESSQQD